MRNKPSIPITYTIISYTAKRNLYFIVSKDAIEAGFLFGLSYPKCMEITFFSMVKRRIMQYHVEHCFGFHVDCWKKLLYYRIQENSAGDLE